MGTSRLRVRCEHHRHRNPLIPRQFPGLFGDLFSVAGYATTMLVAARFGPEPLFPPPTLWGRPLSLVNLGRDPRRIGPDRSRNISPSSLDHVQPASKKATT